MATTDLCFTFLYELCFVTGGVQGGGSCCTPWLAYDSLWMAQLGLKSGEVSDGNGTVSTDVEAEVGPAGKEGS